jgi:hypothetical protein
MFEPKNKTYVTLRDANRRFRSVNFSLAGTPRQVGALLRRLLLAGQPNRSGQVSSDAPLSQKTG